jgi:hypothetical protein
MYSGEQETPLSIDRDTAIEHLTALGYEEGEKVFLRFFFHRDDPKKKGDQGRKDEGNFPTFPWMQMEKYQQEGRGAYFVVNGQGQKDKNITYGKAFFYEHDDLPKPESRDLWQKLGLPEPTIQVDTGGKSIHSYWVLKHKCLVEQWKKVQSDLIEYADADRSNKNPSRVMRLAGAHHQQPGRAPIRSTIVSHSGKTYTWEELRGIIPTHYQSNQDAQGNSYSVQPSSFLPISATVPLRECLSKASKTLVERGATQGSRNKSGFALASDLSGTAKFLDTVGQPYEGFPQELFEQYCQRCSPPAHLLMPEKLQI